MKILSLPLLLIVVAGTSFGSEKPKIKPLEKYGGKDASLLDLSLSYSPAKNAQEAKFTVIVKNVSKDTLSVAAQTKSFYGFFRAKNSQGQLVELCEKAYSSAMVTRFPAPTPVQKLAPGEILTWDVSLSLLRNLSEPYPPTPITSEKLSGLTFIADHRELGVSRKDIQGWGPGWNAAQTSNEVIIPAAE